MTCRKEIESKEAWSDYLQQAEQKEAYDAIGEVLRLALNFESKHKQTSDRMHEMFNKGAEIYAERFGTGWVPF